MISPPVPLKTYATSSHNQVSPLSELQTRNPLIEYYVIEAHGDLSPNEPWTAMGNFTSEEGSYEIYQSTRVNKPSI